MLKNYLLIAWRHILHNRLFSAINIFGLTVGFISCVLLLLFVRDEASFDRWIPGSDQVVRMHTGYLPPDRPPFETVSAAGRMMEAISNYASDQVEAGVRLLRLNTTLIKGDRAFGETVTFADGSFFELFPLPFAHGSVESSFSRPMQLILTEEMARKYFGRTDVVGETLTICCLQGQQLEVVVDGVLKDLPGNTHLDIDFLTYLQPSMFDYAPNLLNTWTSVNTYTYFKLKPGATPESLAERVAYWQDNESPMRDMLPEGQAPSDFVKLRMMRVPDLHLHARAHAGNMGDMRPLGDIDLVYTYLGIAALVLLIACINFMNLSTARASRRAREVALRKVMGASRRQLVLQFLGEAITISLLALLLALAAVELILPLYNQAIERDLDMQLWREPQLLFGFIGIALVVGLVAGSYPALFLSRFLPAKILKAQQSSESQGQGRLRTTLVVFQFAVSIGLAISAIIIYSQTVYARTMDVGYSYSGKLALAGMGSTNARDQHDAIVNELARIPGVSSVVLSSEVPSEDNENNTHFRLLEGASEGIQESQLLNYHSVGFGFFAAYDMEIVAGRSFDRNRGTDLMEPIPEDEERIGKSSVILNESAVRSFGFANPADAVGKTLRANIFRGGEHDLEIIGVAKDVYFRSIKFDIRPTAYYNLPVNFSSATLSFENQQPDTLVAAVEETWNRLVPLTPASHQFLSEMIRAQYQDEERQATQFAVFSLLAVIIACLGLYGLASFTAERRTREIGIRKVMGARSRDIVLLLVRQFSVPVLIANAIAWPVSWFLLSRWLEGFSHRLDVSQVLLASILVGLAAMMIAWLTVTGRALRVARNSPIIALRYE